MDIRDVLSDSAKQEFLEVVLFDSYDTLEESVESNETGEHYCPIFSYSQEEEAEELKSLLDKFESVIEWYVGSDWRKKYELFKESKDV